MFGRDAPLILAVQGAEQHFSSDWWCSLSCMQSSGSCNGHCMVRKRLKAHERQSRLCRLAKHRHCTRMPVVRVFGRKSPKANLSYCHKIPAWKTKTEVLRRGERAFASG